MAAWRSAGLLWRLLWNTWCGLRLHGRQCIKITTKPNSTAIRRSLRRSQNIPHFYIPAGLAALLLLVGTAPGGVLLPYHDAYSLVSGEDELRGLWVDAFNNGIKTPAQTSQLVADARVGNFNALFVQVRKRGDAYYESTLEPKAADVSPQSYDPLADLIAQAHAGPEPLQVHAWIVAYNIWGSQTTTPPQPTHPFTLHPDWLTKNTSGAQWDGANYQFDPALPEVQEHTFEVAMEIVTNYQVDGLHLDYIRYSERESPDTYNVWGYHPGAVDRFNTLSRRVGIPAADDAEWLQFRRDQVTALVRKMWLSVRAARPEVCISAACTSWGEAPIDSTAVAFESTEAYRHVLQDWRGWLEEGILDLAIPMTYQHYDTALGVQFFRDWGIRAREYQANRSVAQGIGFYLNSVADNLAQIGVTRDPMPGSGLTGAGSVGFSYAETSDDGVARQTFLNALTDPDTAELYTPGEPPLFAQPVAVPAQPWKTDVSVGHLSGYVFDWMNEMPVDGAVLTVTGPESRLFVSDATGFFGAVGLAPGDYTLNISQPGFPSAERLLTIAGGQVATSSVTLGPAGLMITKLDLPDNSLQVVLFWPTQVGHTYTVETSPDLQSWTPLATGIPADADLVNAFQDTPPAEANSRFYRVGESAP